VPGPCPRSSRGHRVGQQFDADTAPDADHEHRVARSGHKHVDRLLLGLTFPAGHDARRKVAEDGTANTLIMVTT
jgi:hypothetical protein